MELMILKAAIRFVECAEWEFKSSKLAVYCIGVEAEGDKLYIR